MSHVVVDVESDGPIPAKLSMVCLPEQTEGAQVCLDFGELREKGARLPVELWSIRWDTNIGAEGSARPLA